MHECSKHYLGWLSVTKWSRLSLLVCRVLERVEMWGVLLQFDDRGLEGVRVSMKRLELGRLAMPIHVLFWLIPL